MKHNHIKKKKLKSLLWPQIISKLFRPYEKTELGLVLKKNQLYSYSMNPQGQYNIRCFEHHNLWPQVFEDLAQNREHVTAALLLSDIHYQILTIDKPLQKTSEESLNYAILWQIKNLVDIPLEDIHFDYVDAPPTRRKQQIHVCIVKKSWLESFVYEAYNQGVFIEQVSIEEFALSQYSESHQHTIMMLSFLPQQDLLITTYQTGLLASIRRLKGFADFHNYNQNHITEQIIEPLSLELQRSIDYVENQLKLPPVQRIEIIGDGEASFLAQSLNATFKQTVAKTSFEDANTTLAKLSWLQLKQVHGQ
jgi:MSHA biogenesis protein MshI